eukprot:354243-Chlamydomonas_euryale.AAC.5
MGRRHRRRARRLATYKVRAAARPYHVFHAAPPRAPVFGTPSLHLRWQPDTGTSSLEPCRSHTAAGTCRSHVRYCGRAHCCSCCPVLHRALCGAFVESRLLPAPRISFPRGGKAAASWRPGPPDVRCIIAGAAVMLGWT